MGIASADLDRDGFSDILITNFLSESHGYFRGSEHGLYRDERAATGLQQATINVLGFGTQFLDADNNGTPELFIANGHIDNLEYLGKPYRMPAQFFDWNNGRFELAGIRVSSDYFQSGHLGRAVATFDWNIDGRVDLVVGHLYEPSAVLTNTTKSDFHALQLKLIGTTSPRDSTGSLVECRTQTGILRKEVTAGDGYQCSSEKTVIFGIGMTRTADSISVSWPSGVQQRFAGLASETRWAIREGCADVFWIPR